MRTAIAKRLNLEFPIFAFSHCRDVVVAVSRAGGMGVLGTGRSAPEQVQRDLKAIEQVLDGKPYGVNMVFPAKDTGELIEDMRARLPVEHKQFVESILDEYGVPQSRGTLSEEAELGIPGAVGGKLSMEWSRKILEVVLKHKPPLVASALGPVPRDIVDEFRAVGTALAGMCGTVDHAKRHIEAGTDVIVAQGTEAGGHTGEVATLVLVPDVVDAMPADVPVLAAGGIADGRQVAAAMALGAEGVWTGSVWLTTVESDVDPIVKEKLVKASAKDAVRSKSLTGKPGRQLRTPWIDAWESVDAPPFLPMPLQGILVEDAQTRIYEHKVAELMGTPVGQVVGRMNRIRSADDVFLDLVQGFVDSVERLDQLLATD